ncbi:neuropeptide S [Pangshura tecta]
MACAYTPQDARRRRSASESVPRNPNLGAMPGFWMPKHKWIQYVDPLTVVCLFRLNFILIIWISTMHLWGCYPTVPSTLSRKSDYCLILLNSCLAKLDRSEELTFLKPFLEKSFIKRSFRNGVGSGIKKTSFQRAN